MAGSDRPRHGTAPGDEHQQAEPAETAGLRGALYERLVVQHEIPGDRQQVEVLRDQLQR